MTTKGQRGCTNQVLYEPYLEKKHHLHAYVGHNIDFYTNLTTGVTESLNQDIAISKM